MGNGDLHAKNYSVLQSLTGQWTVSPIYDVSCTLVYGDHTMALSVAGKKRDVRIAHWLEFAETIGLPRKAAVVSLKRALSAARTVDLGGIGFAGSTLLGARRVLSKRHDETARDLDRQ